MVFECVDKSLTKLGYEVDKAILDDLAAIQSASGADRAKLEEKLKQQVQDRVHFKISVAVPTALKETAGAWHEPIESFAISFLDAKLNPEYHLENQDIISRMQTFVHANDSKVTDVPPELGDFKDALNSLHDTVNSELKGWQLYGSVTPEALDVAARKYTLLSYILLAISNW